ncbi:MAG: hypothetical protein U1A27_05815 [Phycisphaerae bacterium]
MTSQYRDSQQPWSLPASANVSSWYAYDDLGNRTTHSHRNASSITYAHDKVHP